MQALLELPAAVATQQQTLFSILVQAAAGRGVPHIRQTKHSPPHKPACRAYLAIVEEVAKVADHCCERVLLRAFHQVR